MLQKKEKCSSGAADVDELPLIPIVHGGAQRAGRPAATNTNHTSEAGLVLEQETHRTISYDRKIQQGSQRFREFFFQASWTAGSLLGCRVSGATLRQPCRVSIR